ncbi:hypothetical protein Tco_0013180 [Tanacetum coccineum]
MRTRSQARNRRQQQVRQTSVESPNLEKPNNNQETSIHPYYDGRYRTLMAQLLEDTTKGYEDAIVVLKLREQLEIRHGLLNLFCEVLRELSRVNTFITQKKDLKGITTQSGVAYQGPLIPFYFIFFFESYGFVIPRLKETSFLTNNGSTEDVQPPVVQIQSHNQISEPDVDPVSAPMPNQRTSIPFPSRRNDERRREKANDQIEKFYEVI